MTVMINARTIIKNFNEEFDLAQVERWRRA